MGVLIIYESQQFLAMWQYIGIILKLIIFSM